MTRIGIVAAVVSAFLAGCVNWCADGIAEGERFEIELSDVWRSTDRFDWTQSAWFDWGGVGVDDVPCGPVDALAPGFRMAVLPDWSTRVATGLDAEGECTGFPGTTTTDVGLPLRQVLAVEVGTNVIGNVLSLSASTTIGECTFVGWALGVLAQRNDAIGLPLVPLQRPPIVVQRAIIAPDHPLCPTSCTTTWAASMRRI